MEKQKLQQHLISNKTKLYGILDGASVPKLPMKLYETKATNFCLFPGDLEPDMVYVAPYVVHLAADHPFTDFVFSQGFGNHWGIFVHSRHSIREMRRHFRSLVNVYDEDAVSLIFRYYDPRVLHKFLPTCETEELKTFFGKVDKFFAESEDGNGMTSYELDNGALKQAELN